MHRTQHIALWIVVVVTMAVAGVEATEKVTLHLTSEWRERFAVKTMDSRCPVEILGVIHDHGRFRLEQVLALIWCESRGNPRAVSKDGMDRGLMGVRITHCKKYGVSENDLFDPIINVTIGLDLMVQEAERYGWNEYHYVSGYNCKKSTMTEFIKDGTPLPILTQKHWARYVKVKRRFRRLFREGFWSDEELPK